MDTETPETNDIDIDAVADRIAGKIGDDAAPAESAQQTESGAEPQDAAKPEGEGGEAQDQGGVDTEPQAPAVEPPPGLTEDERKVFASLPPAAQEVIARRERDRTNELRRGQDEIANHKKAIESERQRMAQQLDTYIQLTQTLDPIIAEGMRTDWTEFSRRDPALAQTKWFEYQGRLTQVQTAMNQRQALLSQQRMEHLAKEGEKLGEKIPEFRADPAKAKAEIDRYRKAAVDHYGYTPEEVAVLPDHRQVLVLRDALAYREMVAAQKSAQAKKVQPKPTPVQKPGGGDVKSSSARVTALKQRARSTGRIDDAVDAVLAALD